MQILKWVIILATIEKVLQHFLTAVFFLFNVPGIGTPGIGTHFVFDYQTMAAFNIVFFLAVTAGLIGFYQKKPWGLPLIAGMAALDIVLEFAFHGLFFITVSVIVSGILVIACLIFLERERSMT